MCNFYNCNLLPRGWRTIIYFPLADIIQETIAVYRYPCWISFYRGAQPQTVVFMSAYGEHGAWGGVWVASGLKNRPKCQYQYNSFSAVNYILGHKFRLPTKLIGEITLLTYFWCLGLFFNVIKCYWHKMPRRKITFEACFQLRTTNDESDF